MERNQGIDLLRIVLMLMVCILHVLGQGGVLESISNSLQFGVYWMLEICCYCAVNGFALISGYTAVNKKTDYKKIIKMWFQVVYHLLFVGIVLYLFGYREYLTLKSTIKMFLPITFNAYWYFTAYVILFLSQPILNSYLFKLNKQECKYLFMVLVFLFTFMNILMDQFKTHAGYHAFWLIVLYMIGYCIKHIHLFENVKSKYLVIIYLLSSFITLIPLYFIGNDILVSYISPTILLNGILLVCIFSKLNIKSKIISYITPLTFGVYLFHLNPIFWNEILDGSMTYVQNLNTMIGLINILTITLIIFCFGIIFDYIRVRIFKLINIDKLVNCVFNLILSILTFVTSLI